MKVGEEKTVLWRVFLTIGAIFKVVLHKLTCLVVSLVVSGDEATQSRNYAQSINRVND